MSLTQALAISLGPAVRVNVISPGWIDVSEWRKRSQRAASALRPVDHEPVSYTHLRAHETVLALVCRLLLETKTTNHDLYQLQPITSP